MQHALDIDGHEILFRQFIGKVVLVVNVASSCGYTEQNYRGLQALYDKYGSDGLEILAFPSNQFGGQEPGTEATIKDFVNSRYGVTFRMMSKVDVNGQFASPVFRCGPVLGLMSRVMSGRTSMHEPGVTVRETPCALCRWLKRNLPAEQGGGGGDNPGNDLVWNFNKFLVERHGRVVKYYHQTFDTERLDADVFAFLSAT